MRIYDCFIFFNKLEVLKFRFDTLCYGVLNILAVADEVKSEKK